MPTSTLQYALTQLAFAPERPLWLHGDAAQAMPGKPGTAYQPWHAQAQALRAAGWQVVADAAAIEGKYDAVFISAPPQREETLGLLALALSHASGSHASGLVMATAPSVAGGARLAGMLAAYDVPVQSLAKSHAKIAWTHEAAKADKTHVTRDLAYLARRPIAMDGQEWWSLPGLFGWNKIDAGSALLLAHLPDDLHGVVADFGCGYGYLSRELTARFPRIVSVEAFDADARAVACASANTGPNVQARWQDILTLPQARRYHAVVMNPPFHHGKLQAASLGRLFIEKAWASLLPGGRLFFIANRQLPYEDAVPGLRVLYQGEGYKILMGRAS